MRVGLMADSHDRIPAIAEFVKLMQAEGVSMLLHAGDYCAPFALRPIEEASMSLSGVFGRNDGDTQGLLDGPQGEWRTVVAGMQQHRHALRLHELNELGDRGDPVVAIGHQSDAHQPLLH